ncbi:hypothetical protein [Streptomyces sp. enrichment culture]|uniref:hypothetical protein n=1 Tax=Streptomyces sp. enrichment culture TaxID=1795815 RepID=UPI003F5749F0
MADSGGIAELAQTAYRLTVADWQLAVAAPRAMTAIEHRCSPTSPNTAPTIGRDGEPATVE